MTDDSGFGHWLAGFVAGEGCFFIGKNGRGARYCGLRIALHHEDLDVLAVIAERTGLGSVSTQNSPSQKSPRAIWEVRAKDECLALVEIFERFSLRAKKARDFEIWAEAVREWMTKTKGQKADWSRIDTLRDELREGRPYRGREAWVA